MNKRPTVRARTCAALLALFSAGAQAQGGRNVAAASPWGPADEIGTLNMMTETSRLEILQRAASGRIYDLAVEFFVGMPTCCDQAFGDPTYQIWMTHAPARAEVQELVSHSGDVVAMATHTGTHIDTLNHFGIHGRIWNQVSAGQAVGARGWSKSGADKYPPIISRGILVDVAAAKNLQQLPPSYAITVADLQLALRKQSTTLRPGDAVLIRTGSMRQWPDRTQYRLDVQAGLSLAAARWLAEEQKTMLLGADNLGLEAFPSKDAANFAPVHSYLLAERGVSFMEALWLEELAEDRVYEFVFLAAPLKLRGATGSPVRPLAIPIDSSR